MQRPIKVLLAKPTHDCHDRGVRYLARKMRDAGFEVIFASFLLPEEVVDTAVQEDVDAIGISCSAGGHMPIFESVMKGLEAEGMGEVLVLGGGVIPASDRERLLTMGCVEVFGPGSTAEAAIELLQSRLHQPA